jgi:hypothetical protein
MKDGTNILSRSVVLLSSDKGVKGKELREARRVQVGI